jgi:hypothetical protein
LWRERERPRIVLRHPETRRRRERHRAAAVSRVKSCYLPRKRLAFHPAKFEPAFSLARSDWQKRDTEQCVVAHSSEDYSHVVLSCSPYYSLLGMRESIVQAGSGPAGPPLVLALEVVSWRTAWRISEKYDQVASTDVPETALEVLSTFERTCICLASQLDSEVVATPCDHLIHCDSSHQSHVGIALGCPYCHDSRPHSQR